MQGEAAGYRTSHKIYILYLYIVRNNEMDKDEGTKENRIPSKKEPKDAKAELSSAFLGNGAGILGNSITEMKAT